MFFSSKIEQKHLNYGGSFRSAATASLACMTISGFFSDKIKFYKINGVSNCYICILYMNFGVQRFFVGAIYTSHIKNITFGCSEVALYFRPTSALADFKSGDSTKTDQVIRLFLSF